MKTITYAVLGLIVFVPALASACFSASNLGGRYGMMGYGGGAHFFIGIAGLVWTIVGVLAATWLWQNINKK